MNVPLRALSWAIRFFWIIALAIAITCVYSVTLIRLNFRQPVLSFTEEEITLTLPIMFDNRGYYNIANFNITTLLTDSENKHLSRAITCVAQIPPQDNRTIFHNTSIKLNAIASQAEYLFNDSDFTLFSFIRLDYANLIPFGIETNSSIHWGAPLFNFTIGVPESSIYNLTHVRARIPVSFQNHSPYFNVTGTIEAEIYDSSSQLTGMGAVSIDVPTNTNYEGEIQILVNVATLTNNGQIHVYIESSLFNYGPMVIDFG